jgi:DHA1 family tetracycline resistance protein-like MFS transporter
MSKTKAIILLTVFIDVIGIGIVIPILPFYVATFSNSAILITSLFAVYALCSFLSAPVIGALSDRVGRRPMLIASIFSTSIGWFIFAGAPNILFLFVGRIVDGIMAGNFPIAQSYLADVAKDEKERTANLGLIGAVFGIGFILGPSLGGILGHFGHSVPFWFVGGLALFNGILALFILPETHKNLSDKPISINPFTPLMSAVKNKILRINYLTWFLFGLAIASYQAVFSLYMRDIFNFNELAIGLIFGGIGLVIAFNQGLAMKHIWLKYFKEPTLELIMLVVFGVGFLLLSSNLFFVFSIALVFTTFGQSILRVVMTSQVVGQSPQTSRGEVLGVLASVASLSMMIGPFLAGIMYENNKILPFLFGALCLFVTFLILFNKRRSLGEVVLPEDVEMESMI